MNTFMKIALGIGAAVVGVKIVIAITEDKTTVDEAPKPVKEVVKEKVNQAVNYAVNNADKIQGAVMLLGLFSTIYARLRLMMHIIWDGIIHGIKD